MSARRALLAALLLSVSPAPMPVGAQEQAPQREWAQDQAPLRAARGTIAPPALQDEIRPRVIAAATARLNDPACRQIAVADTSFNGWSGPPVTGAVAPERPWEETWIVDLCGRIVDVLVLFAPGPQGVVVDIPAQSTHLRP